MKIYIAITSALLASCASSPSSKMPAALANPASTYCIEQGGTVEIRQEAKGEAGYCHLPDGQIVEEWEFFRRKG